MPPAPDPYRTLGLTRDASLAEVKRAYRQLAKEHHPDAAGPAALPRFLAIQAAYEQLLRGSGTAPPRSGPARASAADPTRADATHRAYGGRARRTRSSSSGGTAGTAGRSRSSGSAGPSGATGTTGPDADGATSDEPGRRGKATLGSTSYDGADATPFEPDWSGANWYGTTSGTYWTINPKEYADPRKHGPEYQARARRAARSRLDAQVDGVADPAMAAPVDDAETATAGPDDATSPDAAAGSDEPVHTTSAWWDGTSSGPEPARDATPARPAPRPEPAAVRSNPPPPSPDLGAAATDLGRALTDERSARGPWRIARAVVGWLPIALGLGWVIGEVTGCSRSAASCDGADDLLGPIAAIAALGFLLLVPRLAALAAAAAIAVAIVAIPAAAILSASSGEGPPSPERSVALGIVLLIAWVVGLVVGILRLRLGAAPVAPGGPVS